MNVTHFLARRYMQAGRSNSFFSWISVLTIAGVAIGVAAMIVVWSLINGFETEIRKRFLASNAHIMAYKFPYGMIYDNWAELVEKDFKDDIRGISPFVHYETMARKGSILHAVMIRGIDPEKRERVQSLQNITDPPEALMQLQKEVDSAAKAGGTLPSELSGIFGSGILGSGILDSVILGSGIMRLLEAQIGDTIELIEPDRSAIGKVKTFKIVGVYDSGLKHYDNKIVIMSLPAAQAFFKMAPQVTGLEIGLHKPWNSRAVAAAMDQRYTLSIREWQTFNKPLFDAMQMERVVILLITALVAGVAAFNILTTIFVAVSQRQRDISILKALGASNGQILSMFVRQGAYVGLIGSLIGMVLALAISAVLERYQFVDLPDLYLLAKLPMTYEWWVYLLVGTTSVIVAIVAAFFPAWLASRVSPVEGFRGNQGVAG